MDLAIKVATPDMQRQRGVRDHARGVAYDGHDMNPGAPAIADWQAGWRQAEHDERRARERGRQVCQHPSEVSPP